MRLLGAEPGPLRRLVPWIVALIVLVIVGGATIWARQQDAARRAAEGRAEAAEAELASVQASLTAVLRANAATATALAQANQQPQVALQHALDLVMEAYKDPSDARLRALSDAFSPAALNVERFEAEHLISGGTHLGGSSGYTLQVLSTTPKPPDQAEVRTREEWTYDELDAQNRRSRCVREESDQTYTLRKVSGGWLVDAIQLGGPTRRTDC